MKSRWSPGYREDDFYEGTQSNKLENEYNLTIEHNTDSRDQ
jgi:hypothetical protein